MPKLDAREMIEFGVIEIILNKKIFSNLCIYAKVMTDKDKNRDIVRAYCVVLNSSI